MKNLILAKRIFLILMILNGVLITLHLLFHYLNFTQEISPFMQSLVDRFNMDNEVSVPTWFSQALLLVIALIFGKIGFEKRKKNKPFPWQWFCLSAIFIYLSMDEASEIHELAIEPFQTLLGINEGFLFFAWIIPAILLIGILALVFFKFFLRLPKETKILLTIAAITFVAGAIGMEMISGAYWESQNFVYDMRYRIFNAIEEGLENTGSIIAISALLIYKTKNQKKL